MIKVCIKGQKVTDFSSPQIVADSVDYITAAFHLYEKFTGTFLTDTEAESVSGFAKGKDVDW